MEEKKENSSENKFEVPPKNPWWVKAIPHICIIILFLDIYVTKSVWDMIEVLMWVYIGMRIQSDKFIITKSFRLYFVLLMGVMGLILYGNVSKLIEKTITQF